MPDSKRNEAAVSTIDGKFDRFITGYSLLLLESPRSSQNKGDAVDYKPDYSIERIPILRAYRVLLSRSATVPSEPSDEGSAFPKFWVEFRWLVAEHNCHTFRAAVSQRRIRSGRQ